MSQQAYAISLFLPHPRQVDDFVSDGKNVWLFRCPTTATLEILDNVIARTEAMRHDLKCGCLYWEHVDTMTEEFVVEVDVNPDSNTVFCDGYHIGQGVWNE